MTRGVFSLLVRNAAYRRLWLAQFISFVGDWFTFVALAEMLYQETGRRIETSIFIVAQSVPSLILSSVSGSLADRIPRKKILIACDLLRACGAFGFLIPGALQLHGTAAVCIILLFVLFQSSLTAFFRPAGSACVPNLVDRDELSAAGTLDGISWSIGIIVGSALGGLSVEYLGLRECFVIDSASFIASALLLRSLPLPKTAAAVKIPGGKWIDFAELFAEIRLNRKILVPIFAKCAWGVGMAQVLLLTTFGAQLVGPDLAAAGVGLLYSARGVGTAFAPTVARRLLGDSDRSIRASIIYGFFFASICYFIFGLRPGLVVSLLCIAGAHGGGSMIWIGSTVLLQKAAPDRVRGRAFALEMGLHTIISCAAALSAGALCDAGFDPANLVILFACLTAVFGACWTIFAWRLGAANANSAARSE
ncbi:MAG: MFS transporter [Planctomycetes bacterium]|nr:MFS transporter [Planctomycetota bacterium]